MGDEPLYLVKIPMRPDRMVAIARRRRIPVHDLDDGYLAHCLLAELWQSQAPAPFVLRGSGRTLDIWGYSRSSSSTLIEHARAFGDPTLIDAIDGLDLISSRPMPRLDNGRLVGFLLRACPVARLASARNGHRLGAEVDIFLAKCSSDDHVGPSSREDVYRKWLSDRFADPMVCGARVAQIRIGAVSRTRLVRRTQGPERRASTLERPDVRFEGELIIDDGDAFMKLLARGVGRHKAFGFGALLVVPPGTSYPVT